MNLRPTGAPLLLLVAALAGCPASGDGGRAPIRASIPDIVQRHRPAVLSLEVETEDDEFVGSGFLVSADGLAITNHHVVKGARAIKVHWGDGEQRASTTATVVQSHPEWDLAAIRLQDTQGLSWLEVGTGDACRLGEPIIVLGFPDITQKADPEAGPPRSLTVFSGIISSVHTDEAGRPVRIFSDVSVLGGISGGPALDLEGRLIAVAAEVYVESDAGEETEAMAEDGETGQEERPPVEWGNVSALIPLRRVRAFIDSLSRPEVQDAPPRPDKP